MCNNVTIKIIIFCNFDDFFEKRTYESINLNYYVHTLYILRINTMKS